MIRFIVIFVVIIITIEEHACGTTTKQMSPERRRYREENSEADSNINDNSRDLLERKRIRTKSYINGGRRNSSYIHTPFPMASLDPETSNRTAQLIRLVNRITDEDIVKKIREAGTAKKKVIQEIVKIVQDSPEPVVFLLEPKDLKRDFIISNPEVIEEYRRSRKKKKKKRKDKSTSSEGSDNSNDNESLELDKLGIRRMNYPQDSFIRERDEEQEEVKDEEEVKIDKDDSQRYEKPDANEGVNYDEKSDDYILSKKEQGSTSKRDVWDYEHEDWVVTKKLNWDDVHSSNETSGEKKHKIDKEDHDETASGEKKRKIDKDEIDEIVSGEKKQKIDKHEIDEKVSGEKKYKIDKDQIDEVVSGDKKYKKDREEHELIDREHEEFYDRHEKFNDKINDEHQQMTYKKKKHRDKDVDVNVETIQKDKPGTYSERKDNWSKQGKIDYFDQKRYSDERTSKKYYTEEKNMIDSWIRPNNTNKKWKSPDWDRPSKDYNDYGDRHSSGPGNNWEQNDSKWNKPEWQRPDKPNRPDDRDHEKYKPIRPSRPGYIIPGNKDDEEYKPVKPSRPGYIIPGSGDKGDKDYNEDYKSKYLTTEANYVDSWIKQKEKRKPDNHHYDDDYPRKPNLNDKWENSKEKEFHHKPFHSPPRSKEKYNNMDDLEKKRIARIRPIEPERSEAKHTFDPRLLDEEKEILTRPKSNKKSHLRHAEIQKQDWGTGINMNWNSNSEEERYSNKQKDRSRERGNLDDSRGDRFTKEWEKDDRKPPNKKTKQREKQREIEDLWNRHAHNEWDKVGVEKKTTRRRYTISIRTTDKNEVFNLHGHNDWDKVGVGRGSFGKGQDRDDDYDRGADKKGGRGDKEDRDEGKGSGGGKAKRPRPEEPKQADVSFESKPQSHRSQDSAMPVYFGYVHTPLAFKEKKTIFDD